MVLFLLSAVSYFERARLLTAAGDYLIQVDPLEQAEVIVVLAGDGSGNRIMTAVDLVQRGFAPKILVDGPPGIYGHYESDLAIDYAVAEGAPPQILEAFPINASSTAAEARAVTAELRRRGIRRAILVTSNFHTARAGKIFREESGQDVEYVVTSALNPIFEPDQWWKTRSGKKVFVLESLKTLNSWLE